MKIKNLKINNSKVIKGIISGSLAFIMVGGLSGCGHREPNKNIIINDTSIVGTLDAVKDLTTIDDILLSDKFKEEVQTVYETGEVESEFMTFSELVDIYNTNRANISKSEKTQFLYVESCYKALFYMGTMLIKATAISELKNNNINYDNIFIDLGNFEIIVEGKKLVNEKCAGGLIVTHENPFNLIYKTEKDTELEYLFINVTNALLGMDRAKRFFEEEFFNDKNYTYEDFLFPEKIQGCDDLYRAFERYLLSSRVEGKNDKYINMELDQEKIDAYNEYKNKVLKK